MSRQSGAYLSPRPTTPVDDDAEICMVKPWSDQAECEAVQVDENFETPPDVKAAGLEYFLEVHVTKEVLGVFGSRSVDVQDKVRLLLHYATHDAYPDWVYVNS
ncbi:MAG: hypothetical protein OXU20_00615 [Myxococcales bacterium]|nr:hypothetical protein [Myxococcales bacterium]